MPGLKRRHARPLRSLWSLAATRRRLWLGLLPLALAEVCLDGSLALSYRYLVDKAILPRDGRALALIIGALMAATLAATVLAFWRDRLYARAVASFMAELRRRFHEACQRLPLAYFSGHSSSEALARFSTDLGAFEAWLVSALNTLLLPLLNVLLGLGLLYYLLEWKLAALVCLAWPLVLVLPRLVAPRAAQAQDLKKAGEESLLGGIKEALEAHRLFKAYGLHDFARRRFQARLQPVTEASERAIFLGLMVERSTVVAVYLAQVAALALGSWFAFQGRLSVGGLLSFLTVYWNLGWSLVVLARSAPGLLSARASAGRVSQFLAEEPDPLESRGGLPLAPMQRGLRMEGLSFSYLPGQPVLEGLQRRDPRRRARGSGRPQRQRQEHALGAPGPLLQGRSRAPSAMTAWTWRRQAWPRCAPNWALFSRTASCSAPRRARMSALAGSMPAMPKSKRPAVTPRSTPSCAACPWVMRRPWVREARAFPAASASASLARALLRRPSLLLLDEATSALDAAAEAAIQATLRALKGRCTQVCVTHRLAMAAGRGPHPGDERGAGDRGGRPRRAFARRRPLRASFGKSKSGFVVAQDGWSAEVSPERLERIALLRPLGIAELEALAPRFKSLHLGPGREVLRQGDAGDLFYILVRGRVRRQPARARTARSASWPAWAMGTSSASWPSSMTAREAPRSGP